MLTPFSGHIKPLAALRSFVLTQTRGQKIIPVALKNTFAPHFTLKDSGRDLVRFQAELSTYPHYPQRKKKEQKERNGYYYAFNLLNPEGTDHVLLKGDILTSYEQWGCAFKRRRDVNYLKKDWYFRSGIKGP